MKDCRLVVLNFRSVVFVLVWTLSVDAQTVRTAPNKVPGKPVCSSGAICFSGEVADGERFRMPLTAAFEFVLEPDHMAVVPTGWTIKIFPKRPEGECTEFASVVNAPYRAHRALYIDTSYGWTADDEVSVSPREFRFVTNCSDYKREYDRLAIVMWPYTATQKDYEKA